MVAAKSRSDQITLVVLLENNEMVAFDLETGAERHRVTVTSDSTYAYPGRYLAWDEARQRIIVLTSDGTHSVAVDLTRFSVIATSPSVGARFRTVAIGPVSRSPYLIGDSGAVLTIAKLAPDLGSVSSTWKHRLDPDYGWDVHAAGLNSREDRLLVSYHGPETTGIDRFQIARDSLIRCATRIHRSRGCLRAHGGFVQLNDTIFAAMGWRWIARFAGDSVVSYDTGYDTGLDDRNHVMEIAIDTSARRVVVVDACYRTGSAAVVDLRATPGLLPPVVIGARSPSTPPAQSPAEKFPSLSTGVCGERIDALNGRFVISRDQQVQVLETVSGRPISNIHAGRKIVDLVLVPGSQPRQSSR